ncbi:MAG: serine/threonine-protein kinase, partial [Planctomycetota bacterium]
MKICLSCEGVSTTDVDRCAHCGVPLLPTSAAHFPHRRGEADSTNPLLGTVIDGKFLVQGVLGRGGMGTVFRACHAVSLVPLALKLLHPRLSARAEYRRALLAEARKAGRVVHEHCARMLDVGETEEGTVYLAMELAEGEPLDTWVRGGGLSPSVAVDIAVQICHALVAIHQAGLVHRDLSSRNVLVAVRGGRPMAKVLDFGIAQSLRLAPAAGPEFASGESMFANPVFSAPEHLAGMDVDPRADLYSLGVLLYLMLTGTLPVEGRDARAAARATVTGQLVPMVSTQAIPRRLLRLVHSCLQLDREKRPASAFAVLAELNAVVHGRLPWLPQASLAAMALAVVMLLLALMRTTVPFLRVVGGPLVLVEGSQLEDAPVRYLHKDALRSVRALFGGFLPHRLELEVSKSNTLQWRTRLEPALDSEGVLVFSEDQETWRQALLGIERASVDGPVDLAFVVPGLSLLGGARLCLDATPPEVELELEPSGTAFLNGDAIARLSVRESAGLESLQLVLRLETGAVHAVPVPVDASEFALGAALAEIIGAGSPLGQATLTAVAVDRAGNRGEAKELTILDCDFGAPFVEVVTGPAGESSIPFLEDRAVLRVRLHHDEGTLAMEVRDDEGLSRTVSPLQPLTAGWYEVEVSAAEQGEAFASGLYELTIVDALGNRQRRTLPLAFRSRRLDAVFTPTEDKRIAVLGGELATGPDGG